jgi:hypothetical protein
MTINVQNAQTDVQFKLRGARPNTIYTIWTVFGHLRWPLPLVEGNPPQARLDSMYPEGNAVAPTARLDSGFTNGMGLDPGATFVTNGNGNADIHLTLDFNLLGVTSDDGPPVGNKNIIMQCIPVSGTQPEFPLAPGACTKTVKDATGKVIALAQRVTTTWLRKYVVQVMAEGGDPVAMCANYDSTDPTAIYWQCVDPATVDRRTGAGLPRVFRFPFDHFRLAAHPDDLTHGFIGGNEQEHVIDMVGRRCDTQPLPTMPTQTIGGLLTDCSRP